MLSIGTKFLSLFTVSSLIVNIGIFIYIGFLNNEIENLEKINKSLEKENKMISEKMETLRDNCLNTIQRLKEQIENNNKTCKKLLERRKKLDEKLNDIDNL